MTFNMKQALSFFLALAIVSPLAGCGKNNVSQPVNETTEAAPVITTTTPDNPVVTTTTPIIKEESTTSASSTSIKSPSTSTKTATLPPAVQKFAYDNFNNIYNIVKDTEWIHDEKDPVGWTKVNYQDGLTVHRFTAASSDIEEKSSYLRSTFQQYSKSHPNCFALYGKLFLALQANITKASNNYEDAALQEEALKLMNGDALHKELMTFFGNEETAKNFVNTLSAQAKQGTIPPLHVMQICKSKQGYLLNTISPQDKLYKTTPTSVIIMQWDAQTNKLTNYPTLKISGPTFWYNLIPDFFPDGSLLFTEDYTFAQATLNSMQRWQAYKIPVEAKSAILIEDCIGNFVRDQDVKSKIGSTTIISEQGYQYACKPGYVK